MNIRKMNDSGHPSLCMLEYVSGSLLLPDFVIVADSAGCGLDFEAGVTY